MKGAFSVGVLDEFYKNGLGPDKFDVIYSTSVGIFQQVFLLLARLIIWLRVGRIM